MHTQPYWVAGLWPGRLGIVPRPRGGDWLSDETKAWREAGIDLIVSLLEEAEASELGLGDEVDFAAASGVTFRSLPIADRSVPASKEAVALLVEELLGALRQGRSVAVHCRQSIGRSGLIAGAVFVAEGVDPTAALRTISTARGVEVPETEAQRLWLTEFAAWLASAEPRTTQSHPVTDETPRDRLATMIRLLHRGEFSLPKEMDKKLERANKEKVLRRLARLLADREFRRTTPTFFTRPRGLVVEFVHVHKHSFGPAFRVHLGIRVTNDPFDAAALNGPQSHGEDRFNFDFDETDESVERCAGQLAAFVRDVAEPWFVHWRDLERLLADPESPLHLDDREHLLAAMQSGPLPERVAQTKRILGLS